MSYPTDRIQLFDRDMNPLRELAPNEIDSRVRGEELNGEHELTIVTSRRLEEGWRALTVDGTGKWREWVVVETPEEHSDGGNAVGTYRFVWSLQYDLTHSYSHTESEVGYGSMPKTAQAAAETVLDGVARWEAGTCDGAAIEAGKGCVFIYESAWSKLSKVVELTGWEVDAVIEVSNLFTVTARKLCLKAHVGTVSTDNTYTGRNLLRNTSSPTSSTFIGTNAGTRTGGVIRLTPTSSQAIIKWRVAHLDYEDYVGDTYVISFDAKLADATSSYSSKHVWSMATVCLASRYDQAFDSAFDRYSPQSTYTKLTSDWKRVTNRVRIPEDLRFGSQSALVTGSQITVVIGVSGSRKPVDIRNIKLERGAYATPWNAGAALTLSNVRRFDWGEDVTSIKRTPDPGPYYCRVVPLGRGTTEYADDDETSFEWPLDITEEEPDGNYYIEDEEAATAFRISDGEGGWIYPTKTVSYSEDDPELLYNAALEDLHNHTRPNVTYEANVLQFARAGMAVDGVALGDDVQIIDRGFNPEGGLRLQGRVTSMQVDELSPETGTELTIGNMQDSIVHTLSSLNSAITGLTVHNTYMSTAQYISELLDRINTEINATGGYSYLVPGEGLITYDVAVSDPLVGTEASQVVQIKGGAVRIANSRQTAFAGIDDWEWRTVFTSGHIAADLVTAAQITTGYIGSASSGNYWNLDTGVLTVASADAAAIAAGDAQTAANNAATAAGDAATAAADAAKVATNYLTFSSTNGLDIGYSGSSAKTRIKSNGVEVFDGDGTSAMFAGIESSKSIVRVGRASGSGNVVMSSDGYVDIRSSSEQLAHFGYGSCYSFGAYVYSAYYDLGLRRSSSRVGAFSVVEGGTSAVSYEIAPNEIVAAPNFKEKNVASGANSHAEGGVCEATGDNSHAEGGYCIASGLASHAGGWDCTASGLAGFAHGLGLRSSGSFVVGKYNSYTGSSGQLFVVGRGTSTSPSDAFRIDDSGSGWIFGYIFENSDRRLKEHHAYLGEDAAQFIRALKPALYTKNGEREVGFYAQDVQEAEPEGWDTVTVSSQHTDDSLDFDPLSLNYTALIAPLVAYCQQLEKRIEQLEKMVGADV